MANENRNREGSVVRFERCFISREVDSRSRSREKAVDTFFPVWKGLEPRAWQTEVYWVRVPSAAVADKVTAAVTDVVLKDPFMRVSFDHMLDPVKDGGLSPRPKHRSWLLEKRFRPGVTDNTAQVLKEALALVLGSDADGLLARSGSCLWLELPESVGEDEVRRYAFDVFHNSLIESVSVALADRRGIEAPLSAPPAFLELSQEGLLPAAEAFGNVPLLSLSPAELDALSKERLWALSRDEMLAIQSHFAAQGREPTDVEIEILAQTWSEHCKHKIFAADVEVVNDRRDLDLPQRVDGVFKTYIRGATQKIPAPFLESVFEDNAGVIKISEDWNVAIKVETHNSPSALDPYGGALTGIVGVNRDILGVGLGAAPMANLDVFCVGPLDAPEPLPPRLHHPRRILEGVRLGVEDGGNKSGIPTVTGAVSHHPGFLGKPLVFVGTLGLMPRTPGRDLLTKKITAGSLVVMAGGRIGKDGIHGATFSSLELTEDSPVSAVQLGDPLTQRRVWDFLIEARDLSLFEAVTDNGAGGLSSSIGELARLCGDRGGARIDVSAAGTKYPGLKAFELIVSESQERMSFAVRPERLAEFMALAQRRGVECSVLGAFEDSGRFDILYNETVCASLAMAFLHEGVPRLRLKARAAAPRPMDGGYGIAAEIRRGGAVSDEQLLPRVLSHPNVRSRRPLLRSYDHEVQGRSIRKPYGTARHGAPGDGATLVLDHRGNEGVAVGLGLAPQVAPFDPRRAAELALDEAVRNTVAAGGDPGHMALVDNFCWPDPLPSASNPDAEEKMGALIVTAKQLHDGAVALGMPFVSGKDSMKNDYRVGEHKISVPPTVLVTAMGRVPDVGTVPMGQVPRAAGARILWVSAAAPRADENGFPHIDFARCREFYGAVHGLIAAGKVRGIHDVSDGGWLTATAEMLLGADAGADVAVPQGLDPWFEPTASFVLAVEAGLESAVTAALAPFYCAVVGQTTSARVFKARISAAESCEWPVPSLEEAYHGEAQEEGASPMAAAAGASPRVALPSAARRPWALVLAGDGINCHEESAASCEVAGFKPRIIHVNDLLKESGALAESKLLVLPGGFSFGDELGSGCILSLKLHFGLGEAFQNHLKGGGLTLGICNGFQVLARLGVFGPGVGLCRNSGGSFLNRWVGLKVGGQSAFTSLLKERGIERLELPSRHGEGRLLFADEDAASAAEARGAVAFTYEEDINGAWGRAAGLSSYGGRVLGLMPHPEAFWRSELHPWGSERATAVPLGTMLFESALAHVKGN